MSGFDQTDRRLVGCRVLVLLMAIGLGATVAGCSNSPPKVELDRVARLSTQWYSQYGPEEDETENRLVRELVRQGVLMAARDELGLVTRDETLGEFTSDTSANPDSAVDKKTNDTATAEPLEVWLEVEPGGTWEARLFGAGTVRDNPVWRHQGKFEWDKRTIYAQIATQVAEACPTIAARLRQAGASGNAINANPKNLPPKAIEQQLVQMNFVSQFAAVRSAHAAMAREGASKEWLGVLVRGYAHLALLTEHTWSTHYEAFAARSLLYAERMLRLSPGDPRARWHRAYARAIIGAHGSAIDELDDLTKLAAAESSAAEKLKSEIPAWSSVVEPYVRFEHDDLAQVGIDHAELKELVALLQWNLYRSYMHGRWIYEKGTSAMQECPEAYGIYSVMANWSALMIERLGAYRGMAAFCQRLPERVSDLPELPVSVRAHLDASNAGQRRDSSPISDRPAKLSQQLFAAERAEDPPGECSWAILASMIAEEQFIQAANLLDVSGDAVEHSQQELVEQLLTLIEGHRYAANIRTFALPPSELRSKARLIGQIKIVDPKANMSRLFSEAWIITTADEKTGDEISWRSIWGRTFTHPDLIDVWYDMAATRFEKMPAESRQKSISEFRAVSPHSPNALRLQWEIPEKNDQEQLGGWEKELRNDPVGWMTIGKEYYELGDRAAAMRCYQRSLDISPSYAATEGLAYCHYYDGKKDLWQATLETYLQEEDLSLSHAQVHQRIAEENMKDRNWKSAERHALAAAETYAAWGLQLASRVYEGMQEWDKSEHFAAEAARHYPSGWAGTDWYFWCRRTGHGDEQAALDVAKRSIHVAASNMRRSDFARLFVFFVLDGDAVSALSEYERRLARCTEPEGTWENAWRYMHKVAVACEAHDETLKTDAIKQLQTLADTEIQKTDPEWVPVLKGLCRAFAGEKLDDQEFADFYTTISKGDPYYRCDYSYFIGVALDLQGRANLSELYLRRAAFGGPFDSYNATLAGDRLVKRFGPERGGLPEEFVKQEANAEATVQEEAEAKDTESRESDQSI
jgi:tetratricopeptide (TPR) repeat protein